MCFVKEIEIGNNEEGSGFNQFLSNLIFFLSNQFFLDYTQYIPICQVLKHIKNPQKYPNMVDKLIKNVYNVWIIWGK